MSAAMEQLQDRVAALEALVHAMTEEVRTRRVVVVDETGFERVVAGTSSHEGFVRVLGKSADQAEVMLCASEASFEPTADVYVSARGQTLGRLTATADPDGPVMASLWLQDVYVGPDGQPAPARSAELTTNCLQVGEVCIAPKEVAVYA